MSDWQRLADYLRSAMDQRQMRSQRDLADAAGVSPRTVGDLLRGVERKWIPTTMPAIERAVGWSPGTARRILDGAEPDPPEPDADVLAREFMQAWERLPRPARARLLARLAIAQADDQHADAET